MLKIALLFGGQSHEHPVSLMSAKTVIDTLKNKYELYLVGITLDGDWYHYQGDASDFTNDEWVKHPLNERVILSPSPSHHGFYNLTTNQIDYVDVVLPVIHGRGGEDGTIQGICQLANLPVVSDDNVVCALAIDKEYTHIICESYGVPMAKYRVLHYAEVNIDKHTYHSIIEELGLPFYVKPSREGSSFGAHKVSNYDQFVEYLNDAFSYDEKVLAEEFIPGTEVGCGVMLDHKCGSVFEIVVETEMYGYTEKYDGYKTSIHVPAINLDEAQMKEVRRLSRLVYQALGCKVYGRADFFNSNGKIIFCEINMIPGYTSHSLFPQSLNHAGISNEEIWDSLINRAIENSKEKKL